MTLCLSPSSGITTDLTPELTDQFVAAERRRNCPATATGYALFVVAPEAEHFYHFLLFKHLVYQAVLDIDAA